MKLSELTYEYLESIGLGQVAIHTDCSDALRMVRDREEFEQVKNGISSVYGDVNMIVNPAGYWYEQVVIDDAKWREDHAKYCEEKAAWCAKYGCD